MERKTTPSDIERQVRLRIRFVIDKYCEGSQQILSNKTGVAKASISQYVNGKNIPSNLTAKKLSGPFGINPAWIMGFDVPIELNSPESDSPDRLFVSDPVEKEVVTRYRAADFVTKAMVHKALDMPEKGLSGQSAESSAS